MQGQRTFLLVLLALIVGIVLGWWICERNKKIGTMETDYLVTAPGQPYQAAIGGGVIKWMRQNSTIDKFTVTVPDGICAKSPPFYENQGQGTMSATASGDEVVVCNVLDQSAVDPAPIYLFNFDTDIGSHSQTAPPAQDHKKEGGPPPGYAPDIAGSCQGCGSVMGQAPTGQAPVATGSPIKVKKPVVVAGPPPLTQPPYQIYCTNGAASIAPIVIPPSQTINDWFQAAPTKGWSVKFTSATPCSNGDTFNNYDACYLASDAAPTQYNYTAHLNECPAGSGKYSEAPGTLTITSAAPAPRAK